MNNGVWVKLKPNEIIKTGDRYYFSDPILGLHTDVTFLKGYTASRWLDVYGSIVFERFNKSPKYL